MRLTKEICVRSETFIFSYYIEKEKKKKLKFFDPRFRILWRFFLKLLQRFDRMLKVLKHSQSRCNREDYSSQLFLGSQ